MTIPDRDIGGCARAHAHLLAAIDAITDEHARRPSLLPGWTIGHVLTHVARNADSVVRRLEGASRGEVVDQYAGCREGRRAEIEAGARRSAAALVDDVRVSAGAVDALFASVPADAWSRSTRDVSGALRPAHTIPFHRWREVEVHLVDLGLGHVPADWSSELVEIWLPDLVAGLPQRTDPNALMAWVLGRGPAPAVEPFG